MCRPRRTAAGRHQASQSGLEGRASGKERGSSGTHAGNYMIDLTNRIALVTAGSRGLGAEIVRQLARQGADVVFTYRQEHAAAEALAGEVQQSGRRCVAV